MKQCYAWPDLPTYTEAWKACKTQIVVCVLLSLLVMITAAVLMHNKPLIGDEPGYDAVARSLIAGKGYWYPDYWLSSKAPGYSTFLAGTYLLFGRSPAPARAVQILLHVTMIALAIILAYRMTRSRTVAWITGLLAALDVYVSVYHLHLYSEGLYDPISFGVILAFDDALRRGKAISWLLSGLLFALSVYLRPTLVLLPIVLLLAAVMMRVPMRRLAVGYAIAGMVAFVALLPWCIRNYNVFGAFTPLPAYGGQMLDFHVRNAISRARGEPELTWSYSQAKEKVYKESDVQRKEAVQLMLSHPAVFAVSVPTKAFQLWTSAEWTSAGHLKSKVLGVFRLFALLLALMALFNKRLDGLFKSLALAAIGYATLFIAITAYPEYRYAFWTYPMYYLLIAVSLNALAVRIGLIKSQASSKSEP